MSYLTDFFRSPHTLAMTDTTSPILVALSGGADSCCLLHILNEYCAASGCKLYAAHVNHNIRTEAYSNEAERDEQFCRELCENEGIELFVLNADVPAIAEQSGQSLETAARRVRYNFFADVMQKHGIKILATAHNADDNLETQIFNICRGCSTDGLCGIPRTRPFPEADGVIVRPILDATKAEILDFCRNNGIKYVTDSTNLEDDCTRNRIRHNVIPELVSLFGAPQRAAMRLAASAEEDVDLIRAYAQDFIASHNGELPISELKDLHRAVLTRVITLSFRSRYDASLEAVHVTSIIKLIESAKEQGSVSLPCRARAIVKQGKLLFGDDERTASTASIQYNVELKLGLNVIESTDFSVALSSTNDDGCQASEDYELYAKATLYCPTNAKLYARPRREGDTVLDGAMHKKLKKLMCDKKIDLQDRDALPLICLGDEIIYAPLCAIADTAKNKADHQIRISIFKKHREG